MSLLTLFYDYHFVRPFVLKTENSPNWGQEVFAGYNSKEANGLQKQMYLVSRLFMAYNNLLMLAKSVYERKLLDKVVDSIFIVLANRGAKDASEFTKDQFKTTEIISVFGRRKSKFKTEMRKQLMAVFKI